MKKILSTVLAFVLLLSTTPVSLAKSAKYSDTEGHWAEASIEKWSSVGVLDGYDGIFCPDKYITRGEFAVITDRIMNYKSVADNTFSDLGDGFYKTAVLKLNNADVMQGFGDYIRPDDYITREEAVTMLCRALLMDGDEDFESHYDDEENISSWARPYMAKMLNNGYISGNENHLMPENNITRAETVTIIDNIIGLFCNEKSQYSDISSDKLCIISNTDIDISNCIFDNIIVTEGGSAVLESVIVREKLIVRNTDKSAVILNKCNINKTDATDNAVSVLSEESSAVPTPSPTPKNESEQPSENNSSVVNSELIPDGEIISALPIITTSLQDGIIQRNNKYTFDVSATDEYGEKVKCSVKFNDIDISPTWDDDTKTSYTLEFTEIGENRVEINAEDNDANISTRSFVITYEPYEYGEVIGTAVVCIEVFTVGGGYIVEPMKVDIKNGVNVAYLLDEVIHSKGLDYINGGSLDEGFYLSQISGINNFTPSFSDAMRQLLSDLGIKLNESLYNDGEIGEMDFTQSSGFMYCVNNSFPNVGLSDCYLQDGDVLRVEYSCAYGSDIGGGIYDEDNSFINSNRDELTKAIAEAGIENCTQYINDITRWDITQSELDEFVVKIKG